MLVRPRGIPARAAALAGGLAMVELGLLPPAAAVAQLAGAVGGV